MENPRLQNNSKVLAILRAPLRWLRRLYDWMLGFANHPQAEPALFGLSFAEASFFPLPPDPLLLVMGAAKPNRALRFAVITTIEPSARRDLSAAISLHYGGQVELSEVQETEITEKRRAEILSSSEGFDEEDLAGTSLQLIMLVSKIGAPNSERTA